MSPEGGRRAVVLLSGGLDSATTLAYAVEQGFGCNALTVRYGQRHDLEVERARLQARQLGALEHRVVELDLSGFGGSALTDPGASIPAAPEDREIGSAIPATYVPARNTVFLSLALSWAEATGARDLFVGANAVDYSGYPDCRPEFLRAFESLAELATRDGVCGHSFRVHAPLIDRTKAQIVQEALRLDVDLASTWSCYDPTDEARPCGQCESCRLRARGFAEAGVVDPALAGST